MKNHNFESSVFIIEERSSVRIFISNKKTFEWTFYCVDCGARFVSFRNNLGITKPTDSEITSSGLDKDCNVEIVKKVLSV